MVERRMMPRWVVNGKSYGTALKAYKVAAHELLLDNIFGPKDETVVSHDDPFAPGGTWIYSYWERAGIRTINNAITEGDTREQFLEAFAEKMREWGFECDVRYCYDGEPMLCCEGSAFCRIKYNAWIKNKAKEMMAQDRAALEKHS